VASGRGEVGILKFCIARMFQTVFSSLLAQRPNQTAYEKYLNHSAMQKYIYCLNVEWVEN